MVDDRDDEIRSCFDLVRDPDRERERLDTASTCFATVHNYRSFLQHVTDHESKKPGSCRGLRHHITDRAYDAELATRILIKRALDSLNELYDTDELHKGLQRFASDIKERGTGALEKILDEARHQIPDAFPGFDVRVFDEASAILKDRAVKVQSRGEHVVLTTRGLDGKDQRVALGTQLVNGALGTVSAAQYFGAGGNRLSAGAAPIFVPDSCHHRHTILVAGQVVRTWDAYSGSLAGLSTTIQLMYRHARTVDEIGHGPLRGSDPVTAILVAIGVVAAVLIIVGAVTGNWGVLGFGIVLAAGVICVATGACSLIIAGITVIAA